MNAEDTQKWQLLSLEEQFWNIGSEVSRAINASKINNDSRREWALTRMIDLCHASKSDKRWHHTGGIIELCRAQEVLTDYFYGENIYGSTAENLLGYFDAFAKCRRK